ncbi:MAG TPA: cytochrome c3 family protein, partial [Myxococcales bacterium]
MPVLITVLLSLSAEAATAPRAAKPAAPPPPKASGKVVMPSSAPVVSAPRALAEAPAAGADPNKCTSCHAPLTASRKPHAPVKGGECSACHDPHASSNPTLLKTAPVDALCYKCHAKFDDAEFIHTP